VTVFTVLKATIKRCYGGRFLTIILWHSLQWKEAQKQADIRKREKREDLIARQRVKEQIARDRAEKKAQQEREKEATKETSSSSLPTSPSSTSTTVEHTHARLQVLFHIFAFYLIRNQLGCKLLTAEKDGRLGRF